MLLQINVVARAYYRSSLQIFTVQSHSIAKKEIDFSTWHSCRRPGDAVSCLILILDFTSMTFSFHFHANVGLASTVLIWSNRARETSSRANLNSRLSPCVLSRINRRLGAGLLRFLCSKIFLHMSDMTLLPDHGSLESHVKAYHFWAHFFYARLSAFSSASMQIWSWSNFVATSDFGRNRNAHRSLQKFD